MDIMSISASHLEHLGITDRREVIASIEAASHTAAYGRRYVISRLRDIMDSIAGKTPFDEGISEIYDAIDKALSTLTHS